MSPALLVGTHHADPPIRRDLSLARVALVWQENSRANYVRVYLSTARECTCQPLAVPRSRRSTPAASSCLCENADGSFGSLGKVWDSVTVLETFSRLVYVGRKMIHGDDFGPERIGRSRTFRDSFISLQRTLNFQGLGAFPLYLVCSARRRRYASATTYNTAREKRPGSCFRSTVTRNRGARSGDADGNGYGDVTAVSWCNVFPITFLFNTVALALLERVFSTIGFVIAMVV